MILDPNVENSLERAVEALRSGGVVGMPTETVYGLAGDASSPEAVARIYAIKGRPLDHPVIVHISTIDQAAQWARVIPEYARALADAFWPGPLTLVLPRTIKAGDWVTGGQDSVGLRSPAHPVAHQLIQRSGLGLAAPSANRFGHVSATTARAVEEELGAFLDAGRDLILDGGESDVGLESTIVDCTSDAPAILRLGAITATEIEEVTGKKLIDAPESTRAPGRLEKHYSPRADVVLDAVPEAGDGLIALDSVATPLGVVRLAAPSDVTEFAHQLYSALRMADALELRKVIAVSPAGDGLAAAVRDRLMRASTR